MNRLANHRIIPTSTEKRHSTYESARPPSQKPGSPAQQDADSKRNRAIVRSRAPSDSIDSISVFHGKGGVFHPSLGIDSP